MSTRRVRVGLICFFQCFGHPKASKSPPIPLPRKTETLRNIKDLEYETLEDQENMLPPDTYKFPDYQKGNLNDAPKI